MNILFTYPSRLIPSKGGTERVTCTIANYLLKQGHEVFFCTGSLGLETPGPRDFFYDRKSSYEDTAKFINRTIEKNHIDVVIHAGGDMNDHLPLKDCLLESVKVITCFHLDIMGEINSVYEDFDSSQIPLSFKGLIWKILYKIRFPYIRTRIAKNKAKKCSRILLNSDLVVVPSPHMVQQLKDLTHLCCSNVKYIPNPATFQATVTNAAKEKIVLYVGRLNYQKHVDRIILAWKNIHHNFNDWKLIIAGSGDQKAKLEQLIKSQNIGHVELMGHVDNVSTLYSKASIFVLTSSCESFSMVLLEALQYSCYPIVYDFPAAEELLPTDEWGTRIRIHDQRFLERKLTDCMQVKQTNLNNHTSIQEFLKKFDCSNIGKIWEKQLSEQVKNR